MNAWEKLHLLSEVYHNIRPEGGGHFSTRQMETVNRLEKMISNLTFVVMQAEESER